MNKQLLAWSLCLSSALLAANAQAAVPISKTMKLEKARVELRAAGWKPRDFARYAPSDAMSTFHDHGYNETEQCSNQEYSCVLDYVNANGSCLRVVIEYSTLKPLHAWVSSWTSECPNPEQLKAPPAN